MPPRIPILPRYVRLWVLLASASCACGAAARAAAAQADDSAAQIAPFINNSTMGVIRIQPSGADFDALERWGENLVAQLGLDDAERKSASRMLHDGTQQLRASLAAFNRAGGKTLWVVVSLENLQRSPGFLVVPLEGGADVGALKSLFAGGSPANGPDTVFQSHGALVVAMDPSSVQTLQNIRPQPRPELARALDAAGTAAIQIALIPSEDSRRVVESMLPNLPGGEPSSTLTRGVQWAAAAIQLPPHFSSHAVIQSQDHAAAEKLKDALGRLPKATPTTRPTSAAAILGGLVGAVVDAAGRATVESDRVLVDLNDKQATDVATDLAAGLRMARAKASLMRCMSNMRQIIIAGFIEAEAHQGQWPASLDELAKSREVVEVPELFTNPRSPNRKPAFVYLPPKNPDQVTDRRHHVVLYEAFDQWDGGLAVGYIDGHVEFVQDESTFKNQLHAQ